MAARTRWLAVTMSASPTKGRLGSMGRPCRKARIREGRHGHRLLLTSLIVVVSPGTGVLYTLAAGLSRGPRASSSRRSAARSASSRTWPRRSLGSLPCCIASALAFQTLKVLGVAYLLYMAWSTLRERGALRVETDDRSPRGVRQVIVAAILINILNPRLSIFFFAFLPQFVSAARAETRSRACSSSAPSFMLLTFAVFVGYGLFAAWDPRHVISRPRVLTWMRRRSPAAFVRCGARLALADR